LSLPPTTLLPFSSLRNPVAPVDQGQLSAFDRRSKRIQGSLELLDKVIQGARAKLLSGNATTPGVVPSNATASGAVNGTEQSKVLQELMLQAGLYPFVAWQVRTTVGVGLKGVFVVHETVPSAVVAFACAVHPSRRGCSSA
jgi:hypothetical protein